MTKLQQLLVDFVTMDLIRFLMEDYGLSMEDAMDRVYYSKAFSKITDPETGLYLYGSAHVYERFKGELTKGLTAAPTAG